MMLRQIQFVLAFVLLAALGVQAQHRHPMPTPSPTPQPSPAPTPRMEQNIPGMQMPEASPKASPTPQMQMNMPMPSASPGPTQMPGMQNSGNMNMGLLVMNVDEMGIRVGSSEK